MVESKRFDNVRMLPECGNVKGSGAHLCVVETRSHDYHMTCALGLRTYVVERMGIGSILEKPFNCLGSTHECQHVKECSRGNVLIL